jgi:hypothetical protein
VRPLEERERREVAGYLAKYATKSTEQAGGVLHPVTEHRLHGLPVREHVRRYLREAFARADVGSRRFRQGSAMGLANTRRCGHGGNVKFARAIDLYIADMRAEPHQQPA